MIRVSSIDEVRSEVARARASGRRVAFVPTMGALHEGHLTLLDRAGQDGAFVVVSVFVNPTQFGPGEDLDRYPRDIERDAALCAARGADLMLHPPASEIYAPAARTWVIVDRITEGLCGASRPVHFRGVATVVVKLLNIVRPDLAVFGRKDYQQLKVVQAAVRDLHMAVQVVGVPTARDPDGLAMSSRNAYLSSAERARALTIPRVLALVCRRWLDGCRSAGGLLEGQQDRLAASVDRVDYLGAFDPEDLTPLEPDHALQTGPLVALAVHVGKTRLIDNVVPGEDPPPDVA